MSHALSFSEDFFAHDELEAISPSKRPMSVYQAILSLRETTWNELARDVFGVHPDVLTPEAVLAKAMETNTCSNLEEPVEVWIDPEGDYRVFVHEQAAY